MNAAITGGTGFLGEAVIRQLVPQMHLVRALVRRAEDHARIRAIGAEPVMGDLAGHRACADLVRTGDVVFHAAARVSLTGTWPAFYESTVESTRRLLEHALPNRPRRFVYVSSAVVYAHDTSQATLCAERTPARPLRCNLYARAKLAAERLVRAACDRAGCPWTIVRLGFLYGPGHRRLAEHMQRLAKRRRLFIIGPGDNRIATLYVDDAARAVALAGLHPAAGGRIYDVASDEAVTQRQFLQATADALGLPRPRRHVPVRLAYAAAAVADLATRIPGIELPLSRAIIRLMSADQVFDTSRIRNELGWQPEVSFADGMARTGQWYRAQRTSVWARRSSTVSEGKRRSA